MAQRGCLNASNLSAHRYLQGKRSGPLGITNDIITQGPVSTSQCLVEMSFGHFWAARSRVGGVEEMQRRVVAAVQVNSFTNRFRIYMFVRNI